MRRNFVKLGLVVSLSAMALVVGCGPKAGDAASNAGAAATNSVADAGAAATNAVADTGAAATNAVADAGAATTNTVAAATNTVAAGATNAVAGAAPAAGMVALAVKDAAGADMSGDPTKGEAVFRQCQTCHVKQVGVNKVGPSLAGVVGRPAGSVPGFNYSAANKGSGITWTEQEIYVYLENPRAKVPGTNMAFVGIKDSQKRADVIAYLKQPS